MREGKERPHFFFGEEVKVLKVAPMGDPIEVNIKSYSLSLRKKEAEGIAVEVTA